MSILKNQKEITRYLVEQCQVDINQETRLGTPLAVATKKNQVEGMKYLLAQGANTANLLMQNQRKFCGTEYSNSFLGIWSIMHECAKEGNLEIIQMLTDTNVPLDCQDPHGWTACKFVALSLLTL